MKTNEINLRDPFILPENGIYYMYGTRGKSCWGPDTGLDCYTSTDLENWEGPVEIFRKPEGFWADRNFWAPECHKIDGAYYLFVTFKSADKCRGTQILRAENPLGPFLVHSPMPITPPDWECLDGTYFQDRDGKRYMVFCHEWLQIKCGTVCAVELSQDLTHAVGEPIYLFSATDAKWSTVINQDVHTDDCYVTDGPFLFHTESGKLMMLWSSFSQGNQYTQGLARSLSGTVPGPWVQEEEVLYASDGGHGMIFRDFDGKRKLVLHAPNQTYYERPQFLPIEEALKRFN